eukprot:CAMPEP_0170889106 /NCGR_PEP_ID=MMETSP0734-20130129/39023_1 /TAXON_ID=186038 /ORGANISM="Fragilariopsis kerguelensis, Strain L26-C5" /LENGTH=95 /DNA_ID=CAMNT_0011277137 /DNA_START=136 /DNA_END=423 /DNA_ORIENTATION=-
MYFLCEEHPESAVLMIAARDAVIAIEDAIPAKPPKSIRTSKISEYASVVSMGLPSGFTSTATATVPIKIALMKLSQGPRETIAYPTLRLLRSLAA